jgi:hypothetical protein
MRPLNSLSLESLVELLSSHFSQIDDRRDPYRINYSLHDTLMTGFAMFFFQHPSLLQFQATMKEKRGRCNLETIFGVRHVPSETQMRDLLDEVDVDELGKIFPVLFERIRRAGWADQYQTDIEGGDSAGAYYVMALDGTDYFSSMKIDCANCLQRKDKNGQLHFYHGVVAATLVRSGSHQILPMDAEMIANRDGHQKQDCEINAAKRLIERLRLKHRQMAIILTGDDLYSREPFIEKCKENRLNYVLVAKPDSHREMMQWVEEIEKIGGSERGQWQVGPACKRKNYEYLIVREVPLTVKRQQYVTYIEVWENNKEGKLVYHNAWVTDLDVTRENVGVIVGIGRSRWKIENEHFNVQKNHGYELEHNYGHGKKNLSMIFYQLNLLAFMAHKIIDRGDRLYQRYMQMGESRREMWNVIRTLMKKFLFDSWGAMMKICLGEEAEASP